LYTAIQFGKTSNLSNTLKTIYEHLGNLSAQEKFAVLDKMALLAIKDIDYIIGNPPWVNWEYLPKEYRKETESIWQYYELFDYKGLHSVFIKEDISALITYVVVDNHLKEKGHLGFVLKESLFKSAKQGAGFRKFFIPNTKTSLYPYSVHDLTKFSPFPGINNKTFVLLLRKGVPFSYPVLFTEWIPGKRKTFSEFDKREDVIKSFTFVHKLAQPIKANDLTSGWITVKKEIHSNLSKYLGKSAYKARTGVFTGGANAIYWMRILSSPTKSSIEVENITERAKNKMKQVNAKVEKQFVYPLITGSEISFWNYKYSKYILLPHTKEPKRDREA
jgi:hypothetical protein